MFEILTYMGYALLLGVVLPILFFTSIIVVLTVVDEIIKLIFKGGAK